MAGDFKLHLHAYFKIWVNVETKQLNQMYEAYFETEE